MSAKAKSYSQQQLAVLASSFPNLRISVESRPPVSFESVDTLRALTKGADRNYLLSTPERTLETFSYEPRETTTHYLIGPPERDDYHRRGRIGAIPLSRRLRPTISNTQHVLNQLNFHTRTRIKKFMGEFYDHNNYSKKIWDKIKETQTDLAWVANLNGFDRSEFYDFLVPVRLLNEAVYWMDAFVEDKKSNDWEQIMNAFRKRGQMYSEAVRYMTTKGKGNLTGSISQIMYAVDINYVKESFNQVNQKNKNLELELKQLGPAYEEFLEPSDQEYLDTGSYGTMYSHWFDMKDKNRFQILWNNSRRATDVIDGLVDFRDDIEEGVFCPITVYVYNQCPEKEKEVIMKTFSKGTNILETEEVIQKHSRVLLNRVKDYVDNISPENKNVRMFKERTMRIIDFGIGMTTDLSVVPAPYNRFYNHSLD